MRTRPWKWRGEKGNSLILAPGSLPLSVSVSTRSLPGPINKVLSSSSSAAAAGKKWGTKVREGRPFSFSFFIWESESWDEKKIPPPAPDARTRSQKIPFSQIYSFLYSFFPFKPNPFRSGDFQKRRILASSLHPPPPLNLEKNLLSQLCVFISDYIREMAVSRFCIPISNPPLPCIRENVNQRRGKCQLCAMRGRGGCKGSRGTGKGVVGS